jgi:hypothetical protein
LTAGGLGAWPEFERSEISLQEVLTQLHEWLGEMVRVEVQHVCEAGLSAFYGKLHRVEPGAKEGEYLVHLEDEGAWINLSTLVLSFFRITSTNGTTGWLEFDAGPRRVLEIGLEDVDEVWRRADEEAGQT